MWLILASLVGEDAETWARLLGALPQMDGTLLEYLPRIRSFLGIGLFNRITRPFGLCTDRGLANRLFCEPPGVSLATPVSSATLESSCFGGLRFAEADVNSCSHSLRIREEVGRWLCLLPLRPGQLRVSMVSGGLAEGLDVV